MKKPIERNKYQSLGYKTYWLFVFKKSFSVFIFGVFSYGFFIAGHYFSDTSWQNILNLGSLVSFSLALLSLALAFLSSFIDYISFRFMFTDTTLQIEKGILHRKQIMIPYQKIQSINIDQRFFHQLLGVCQLIILTAGNPNQPESTKARSGGILPAIDVDIAHNIKNEILKMMEGAQKNTTAQNNIV